MKKLTIAACLALLIGAYSQPASAREVCISVINGRVSHSCNAIGIIGAANLAGAFSAISDLLATFTDPISRLINCTDNYIERPFP